MKQTNLGTFSHDARHRLIGSTFGSTAVANHVNALGQRVQKVPGSSAATVLHCDKDGRLIAEGDAAGNIKNSYVYLNDLPVGMIAQSYQRCVQRAPLRRQQTRPDLVRLRRPISPASALRKSEHRARNGSYWTSVLMLTRIVHDAKPIEEIRAARFQLVPNTEAHSRDPEQV